MDLIESDDFDMDTAIEDSNDFSDKDYFWRTDPFHYLSSTGKYFFENRA